MKLVLLIAALAVTSFTLACSESKPANNANSNKPASYTGSNMAANTAPAPSSTIDLSTPKIATPVPFDVDKSGDTPHKQPPSTPKPEKTQKPKKS
jgi:hypothetical protein